MTELRLSEDDGEVFSLYLRGKLHPFAIIALTEEGDLVLGLSIDDPENSHETLRRASDLMASLKEEFGATDAICGGELPPPHSASEWREDKQRLSGWFEPDDAGHGSR